VDNDSLLELLKKVPYPGFSRDIVSFGLIKSATFSNGVATVQLAVTTADNTVPPKIKQLVEEALASSSEIQSADVSIQVSQPGASSGQQQQAESQLQKVKHVVAIASGKGGVGKSTFTVNLACAMEKELAQGGRARRTGVMDCDIYGPSVPLMLGLGDRPEVKGELLMPVENFGVRAMSIGLLVDDDTPLVLRGPRVTGTIQQFATNVDWGELDVLVVDLPPGTGDAQLTLAQTLPLSGAVVVTPPQAAAVNVARRGARMFDKVSVPILGVVENMSYLAMPDGSRQHPFGQGGGKRTADALGTGLLGEVPLEGSVREGGDRGIPVVISHPDSEAAKVFFAIARKLLASLKK